MEKYKLNKLYGNMAFLLTSFVDLVFLGGWIKSHIYFQQPIEAG